MESRNFAIRKNVLQFDDVMNRQREIIYGQREKVLDGEDLGENISKMVDDVVSEGVARYLPDGVEHQDWNLSGLREYFRGWITTDDDLRFDEESLKKTSREEITAQLTEKAHALYAAREEKFSSRIMRELERIILLKNVDTKWMDHIDAMEELKKGIYLRSYGQKDPVVEYRLEGFEMFDELIASIREDTVKMLLTVQLRTNAEPPKREQVAKPTTTNQGDGTVKQTPAKKTQKIGRNDPCPCGSGLKYKKCCGKDE